MIMENKNINTAAAKDNFNLLANKLCTNRSLSLGEYETLIKFFNEENARALAQSACRVRKEIYGNDVFVRGLIEISNVCKNDCFYCGIRRSNTHCDRYILSDKEIFNCCDTGYVLGFRTFVLQGGEGVFSADKICGTVYKIKDKYPDCAVTLSLGEFSKEDYKAMFDAGADRYLLRHETADKEHYEKLHPSAMSFDNRMRCLYDLKEIGYQVGCGFMVGSPYQTTKTLAKDLKFIEKFAPDMCGIGPFIPHKATPFAAFKAGNAELTCYLLSIIRLIHPNILLPATTALGTVNSTGREKGVLSGANVVMPNLSPVKVRKKYELYDNKICTGEESAQCRECLNKRMQSVGYKIVTDRGDIKK